MKKKGSLELSVNSIVILIIAIAVLGLIIGFIYNQFNNLVIPAPEEEPVAPGDGDYVNTAPASLEFPGGQKAEIKLAIYNPTSENITATPEFNCTLGAGRKSGNLLEANPHTIPAYSYESFVVLLNVPKEAKDKYLCTWTFDSVSVDDSITIK